MVVSVDVLDLCERVLRIDMTGALLCGPFAVHAMSNGKGRCIMIPAPHNVTVNAIAARPDRGRPSDYVAARTVAPALGRMMIKRAVQPKKIDAAALFPAERDAR